jgi:hypothetical protein
VSLGRMGANREEKEKAAGKAAGSRGAKHSAGRRVDLQVGGPFGV